MSSFAFSLASYHFPFAFSPHFYPLPFPFLSVNMHARRESNRSRRGAHFGTLA